MTPADLAAIEARCEAATEGPWHTGLARTEPHNTPQIAVCGETFRKLWEGAPAVFGEPIGSPKQVCQQFGTDADAAFIAASRSDVPALLAEVRRLQADNERMRRGIRGIIDATDDNTRDAGTLLNKCDEIAVRLLTGREWSESEGK